jgi:hypothetical protein
MLPSASTSPLAVIIGRRLWQLKQAWPQKITSNQSLDNRYSSVAGYVEETLLGVDCLQIRRGATFGKARVGHHQCRGLADRGQQRCLKRSFESPHPCEPQMARGVCRADAGIVRRTKNITAVLPASPLSTTEPFAASRVKNCSILHIDTERYD